MGNSIATAGSCASSSGKNSEEDRLQQAEDRVSALESDLKEKLEYIECIQAEIKDLRDVLQKKDQEVLQLSREVHKLKSVLEVTSAQDGTPMDLLSTSHRDADTMPVGPEKKQGVSGESALRRTQGVDIAQLEKHEKDFRSKQLIKDALMENDFLKNLVSSQVREIVDCMYSEEFSRDSPVIKEGDPGSHFYVSAEGELEVLKNNKVLGRMGPGKAFGELAILYNCKRTASVKAVTDAKVWMLDRKVFQAIMMISGLQRQKDNINFLKSVPLLQNLNNELLAKIADVLELDFYPAGEYIIRQGTTGDTFFIISNGQVKVTKNVDRTSKLEEEVRTLGRGEYFGEQALLREDRRTANVIALDPGVECLTLDRDSFNHLIGDLQELQTKEYGDVVVQQRSISLTQTAPLAKADLEYAHIQLEDLDFIATLGVGGFGRVELVQYIHDKSKSFALKVLQKKHIVETEQQEHVLSERNIMMSCRHSFICRMYKTFKDSKYVYMLMEPCLGGEVWSILRDRNCFDDSTTRFYIACVTEALEYLHKRNIIYRDLKPENLMLDSAGYAKLVDFGFSKILVSGKKTWTFCGTPEYVAPEIILSTGHDKAVDYWSIGILMYELFTGTPPFTATDPVKTYKIILRGFEMLNFPSHISKTALSLMKRLCRENPSERLGYQKDGIVDIRKHKWFQGFDWDGLRARTLVPPIIPDVRGPTDTSNFDVYPKIADPAAPENSGWDKEF